MLKSKVKYLVLSDIHLGHPKNKTDNIISNLNQFFIQYHNELQNLDILFIAGDIFDRLLSSRSIEYRNIMSWLSNTLLWCRDNNIIFRILYGTPSHDNDQIASFTEIAKKLAPDADYKYINTLSIEKIESLGISVLYVPDEWKHDSQDTYQDVLKLLQEQQLAEVDIGIMHGCFRFQMPILDGMKFVHNESNYLDIVKYYITIGHIHTSNAYERILAPGSFDRLAHGEEESKGALLCTINNDNTMSFKFLENHRALTFKTFRYIEQEESEIIANMKKDLKKLKEGSYVRIEVKNDNKLLKTLKEVANVYSHLHIKFKTDNEVIKKIDILDTVESKAFEININNIQDLMLQELNLNSQELVIFNEELQLAMDRV